MLSPTPRQLQILRFIRDYRRRSGYSPTMQEIGDSLQLTKVTVFEHVAGLEKKGLLSRGPKHSARSLQVSEQFVFPDEGSSELPLVGSIAAGLPILIPGIGAQGGDLEASVIAGTDDSGGMAVVNSSRGILYASGEKDFAEAARKKTEDLKNAINAVRREKQVRGDKQVRSRKQKKRR